MKSKENGKERQPLRVRIITGLAVEYTVGPPHGDNPEMKDGNQILSDEDIASVILSDESVVLAKMMGDCFRQFREKYPACRASAQLIPVNGITEPMKIGGD